MQINLDNIESIKIAGVAVNIFSILLSCFMLQSLLRKPSAVHAVTYLNQNYISTFTEAQSAHSPTRNRPHYERWNASIKEIKRLFYSGLARISHSLQEYIQSFGWRHLNRQKWLRLAAVICMLICTIARLYTSVNAWNTKVGHWENYPAKYGSLLYSISFWMLVVFYSIALLDRFERIEMLVPKTWQYVVCQMMKLLFLIMGVLIVGLESYSKVRWIRNENHDIHVPTVNETAAYCEVIMGSSSLMMEIVLNVKLIFSALKRHVDTPTTPSPTTAIKLKRSKRYIQLRNKMYSLYALLLLFDAASVSSYVIGFILLQGADTFFLFSTACITIHLYVSFKLLDVFLHELKRVKAMKTTLVAPSKPSKLSEISETDLVTEGLLPYLTSHHSHGPKTTPVDDKSLFETLTKEIQPAASREVRSFSMMQREYDHA